MKGYTYLLGLTLLSLAHSAKVVDLYGKFDNFTCLAQQGYTLSIVRAYHSYGAIDVDAPNSIQRSNNAGLSTDVYMFPCRGKNASTQVNELVNYLEQMTQTTGTASRYEFTTGTIWLDVETNPSPGCTWAQGTGDSNCAYLKEVVDALEARGRSVGIYASGYMWNQIMGSKTACTSFSQYPLWYAHYDGK
jgi:hypothetical protein